MEGCDWRGGRGGTGVGGSRMRGLVGRRSSAVPILLVAQALSGSSLYGQAQGSDASRIFDGHAKSVLVLVIRSELGQVVGSGTGFVVAGGRVVTNEHVVREGRVFVDLGAAVVATMVQRVDASNDLAVLSVGAELSLKPLALADGIPEIGASVYVIGNPAGLERTISTGIISGVRTLAGRQLLQITAPISPGSSGGPVLNSRGEVVGVTVGMLTVGQNLNFAAPAPLVRQLLAAEPPVGGNAASFLQEADALTERLRTLDFSLDPDSPWQRLTLQIKASLQRALEHAGADSEMLLRIARASWSQAFDDVAIAAADRAVLGRPSVEGHLLLARGLQQKALLAKSPDREALLERAEKAARAALRLSSTPNAATYYLLADILEDRGSVLEAEGHFRRALELSRKAGDLDTTNASLRGLVRTAFSLGKPVEGKAWFKALADSGKATAWDWRMNGQQHDRLSEYGEAGASFRQAALLGGGWEDWCEAAGSYAAVPQEQEAALFTARKCVSEGSGQERSETNLAMAHRVIADVLNDRGVYQEALTHAREATALASTDPWAFNAQARALFGLRRFQEATSASQQAVRLSDGKFATMHFSLASSYFELENWELARQSFQKAAELSPSETSAPYNVALCLVRLGFYRDAAMWYEEVLRRDPAHRNRQEILNRIQALRR
jgi:tetratricopeptide (TPR) repeat protein